MTTLLPHPDPLTPSAAWPAEEVDQRQRPGADPQPEAARLPQWRDAVLEVQAAILSGTDVDAVLHTVADVALHLIDGDVATVAMPRGPERRSLVLRAACGYRAAELRGVVFPIEESLSGQTLETGRSLHIADASAHENAYQPICELGDLGPALLLPLDRGAGPFGTLLVARRRGRRDYSREEHDLLQLFAAHVSVSADFCRSQEELQRLAAIEESERVGRELHDTVLQRLFAIGLRLQALSRDEQPAVDGPLQSVLDELDGTVREIRRTVLDSSTR